MSFFSELIEIPIFYLIIMKTNRVIKLYYLIHVFMFNIYVLINTDFVLIYKDRISNTNNK